MFWCVAPRRKMNLPSVVTSLWPDEMLGNQHSRGSDNIWWEIAECRWSEKDEKEFLLSKERKLTLGFNVLLQICKLPLYYIWIFGYVEVLRKLYAEGPKSWHLIIWLPNWQIQLRNRTWSKSQNIWEIKVHHLPLLYSHTAAKKRKLKLLDNSVSDPLELLHAHHIRAVWREKKVYYSFCICVRSDHNENWKS